MAAAQKATSVMQGVFPESHATLKEADPEVFGIIEDEKERQWRCIFDICRELSYLSSVAVACCLSSCTPMTSNLLRHPDL